jgi:hypothetical protein
MSVSSYSRLPQQTIEVINQVIDKRYDVFRRNNKIDKRIHQYLQNEKPIFQSVIETIIGDEFPNGLSDEQLINRIDQALNNLLMYLYPYLNQGNDFIPLNKFLEMTKGQQQMAGYPQYVRPQPQQQYNPYVNPNMPMVQPNQRYINQPTYHPNANYQVPYQNMNPQYGYQQSYGPYPPPPMNPGNLNMDPRFHQQYQGYPYGYPQQQQYIPSPPPPNQPIYNPPPMQYQYAASPSVPQNNYNYMMTGNIPAPMPQQQMPIQQPAPQVYPTQAVQEQVLNNTPKINQLYQKTVVVDPPDINTRINDTTPQVVNDPFTIEDPAVRQHLAAQAVLNHMKKNHTDGSAFKADPSDPNSNATAPKLVFKYLDTYKILPDDFFKSRLTKTIHEEGNHRRLPPITSSFIIKADKTDENASAIRAVTINHKKGWNDEQELIKNYDNFIVPQFQHIMGPTDERPNKDDPIVFNVNTFQLQAYEFDYDEFQKIQDKLIELCQDEEVFNDEFELADKTRHLLNKAPSDVSRFFIKRIMYTWNQLYSSTFVQTTENEQLPLTWEGFEIALQCTTNMVGSSKISHVSKGVITDILGKSIKLTVDITQSIQICDPNNPDDIPDIIHADAVYVNIRNEYNKYDYANLNGESACTDKEEFIDQLKRYVVFKDPIQYIFYRPTGTESFYKKIGKAQEIDFKKPTDGIPHDTIIIHKVMRELVNDYKSMIKFIFFDDTYMVPYRFNRYVDERILLTQLNNGCSIALAPKL